MIWQNPWGWAGLAAIAIPILLHLLGRGPARVQPFPTLRFLDIARLTPTRRTRIHDVLLLLVRASMLALVAAALAAPLLLTRHRQAALDAVLARAIVVDTSASMRRPGDGAIPLITMARQRAAALAAAAPLATIVETAEPTRAVRGAAAWLATQTGRREIVIISDFQVGALDSASVAAVTSDIGVQLVRVATSAPIAPLRTRVNGNTVTAEIMATAQNTAVDWTAQPATSDDRDPAITLLTAPAERARGDAAMTAAATTGAALPFDTARAVTIVYRGAAEWSALTASSSATLAPWMADLFATVTRDDTLAAALRAAATRAADGRQELLLFADMDPGSIASATLIAALRRGLSLGAPPAELEPATLDDGVLRAWQRPPATVATTHRTGDPERGSSDGRWFWLAALTLLGVEAWLRNRTQDGGGDQIQPHVA
ncbi:MAG TPA: BatA domain-containing protein [Gemmatimonadales bacterium]|nr:BatA domain-containing protein [Gemmatimonadales bacterium]